MLWKESSEVLYFAKDYMFNVYIVQKYKKPDLIQTYLELWDLPMSI